MASQYPYIDGGELGGVVDLDACRDVADYLHAYRPSCHSDTGEALMQAAVKCGEWVAYSPSFGQCLYVALVTQRKIFALGLGQRFVLYRLPADLNQIALASGAVEASEIGTGWVRFELFRPNWPAPDLPFWTLRAYAAARQSGA